MGELLYGREINKKGGPGYPDNIGRMEKDDHGGLMDVIGEDFGNNALMWISILGISGMVIIAMLAIKLVKELKD